MDIKYICLWKIVPCIAIMLPNTLKIKSRTKSAISEITKCHHKQAVLRSETSFGLTKTGSEILNNWQQIKIE